MIFTPPRHGKSTMVSQYFTAYFLGTHPDQRVMLCAYGDKFAAVWGRRVRRTLEWLGPRLYGIRPSTRTHAWNMWDLHGRSGGMMTAGVGGPITGHGADLMIIEDPLKNSEEAESERVQESIWDWWLGTARTRLEPGGAVVLVMTRWSIGDLAGRLLKQTEDGEGEPWQVLRLPALAEQDDPLGRQPGEALWPERIPIPTLLKTQAEIQPHWWRALYQQDPHPRGSCEFPPDLLGPEARFDDWPRKLVATAAALDPSKGRDSKAGDYSAFCWGGIDQHGVIWCDARLERIPLDRIVDEALELNSAFAPEVFLVEANAFQELLADGLHGRATSGNIPRVKKVMNDVAKVVRIRRLSPLLAGRRIRFKARSPGISLLLEQLRQFPTGRHDDGPDALELLCRELLARTREPATMTFGGRSVIDAAPAGVFADPDTEPEGEQNPWGSSRR